MNENIKRRIYKNRVSILFIITVIIIFIISILMNSNFIENSNKINITEKKDKDSVTEYKIIDEENIIDKSSTKREEKSKKIIERNLNNDKKINRDQKKPGTDDAPTNLKQNRVDTKDVIINKKNPIDTVNALHNGLIKIGLKKSFDLDEIVVLINQTFNVEKMISIIIGNKWDDVEPKLKEDLITVFEEYIAKNYFKRFSKINEPKFLIKNENKISEYLLIKTVLVIKNVDEVRIDYLLSNDKYGWKIFDVLIDGAISEIATKKSEFSVYIQNNNIESLINALRKINSKLIK